MRTNTALQVIFAFFLGLVVVAFVGIGVNTFYPEPDWTEATQAAHANWQLVTGVVLLVCATILLVVSLLLPEVQGVLSNGVLLGGVFTMVYAVGMTVSSDRSILRFVVVAAALAVTIVIGYLKFARRRAAAAATVASAPADAPVTSEFSGRLAVVEQKLDAIARALQP